MLTGNQTVKTGSLQANSHRGDGQQSKKTEDGWGGCSVSALLCSANVMFGGDLSIR